MPLPLTFHPVPNVTFTLSYIHTLCNTPTDLCIPPHITHPEKQKEYIASRSLLRQLRPDFQEKDLYLLQYKKPMVYNNAYFFSVSHSKDICSVIYAPGQPVAIDIQQKDPRLSLLKKKFMSDQEINSHRSLTALSLIWSIKEAVYKYLYPTPLILKKDVTITLTPYFPENAFFYPDVRLTHPSAALSSGQRIGCFVYEDFVGCFIC